MSIMDRYGACGYFKAYSGRLLVFQILAMILEKRGDYGVSSFPLHTFPHARLESNTYMFTQRLSSG